MPRLGTMPLSSTEIDRDGAARESPGFLETVHADPATRYVTRVGQSFVMAGDGDRLRYSERRPVGTEEVFLGRLSSGDGRLTERTPVVAVSSDDEDLAELPLASLRDVGIRCGRRDSAVAVEAAAVLNWHDRSRWCARCGAETRVRHAGWMRECSSCRTEHFPRTDPAVIVRVTDAQDRLLLGSNAAWQQTRFSLLAGFVEAGESLEDAVVREVEEEAGVRVGDVGYLGSQPWPFPRSLMLGFSARAVDDAAVAAARPDGEEILEVRWFTREELTDPRHELMLPGPPSIAHAIIQDWLGERP